MTLKYLLPKFQEEEILIRLFELYPDQKRSKQGYIKVIKRLRKIKAKPSKMALCVRTIHEDGEDDWVKVSGIEEDQFYAVEFSPWDNWLGWEITEDTQKNFKELDILCHSLWEMTWSGFDQREIQGKLKGIVNSVKEIQKDVKLQEKTQSQKK